MTLATTPRAQCIQDITNTGNDMLFLQLQPSQHYPITNTYMFGHVRQSKLPGQI